MLSSKELSSKLLKSGLSIVVLLLMTSCSAVQWTGYTPIKLEGQNFRNITKSYELQERASSGVGDAMLSILHHEGNSIRGYRSKEDLDRGNMRLLEKGSFYFLCGKTDQGILIRDLAWLRQTRTSKYGFEHLNYALEISPDGYVQRGLAAMKEDVKITFFDDNFPKYQLFYLDTMEVGGSKNIKYTLSYLGKNKNVIKVDYSEFIDGTARPAFNKTLEYDLDEGMSIKIKGIVIDVIEADNNDITFIVKDDTNSSIAN